MIPPYTIDSKLVNDTIIYSGVGDILIEEWHHKYFPHQAQNQFTSRECQFSIRVDKLYFQVDVIYLSMTLPKEINSDHKLHSFEVVLNRFRPDNPLEEFVTESQYLSIIALLPGYLFAIKQILPNESSSNDLCMVLAQDLMLVKLIPRDQIPHAAFKHPEKFDLKMVTLHPNTPDTITHAFVIPKV